MKQKKQKKDLAAIAPYYLLYESSNQKMESVDDYEMKGDFSPTVLWTGKEFNDSNTAPAVVTLEKGKRSDCLGGPLSWFIVSPRFVELCGDYLKKHIQMLQLITRLPDGKEESDRYVVVNPLGTVDALACLEKEKKDIDLLDMVLDTSKIPKDRLLFRPRKRETLMVAASCIVQIIYDNGLTGFSATPLQIK